MVLELIVVFYAKVLWRRWLAEPMLWLVDSGMLPMVQSRWRRLVVLSVCEAVIAGIN